MFFKIKSIKVIPNSKKLVNNIDGLHLVEGSNLFLLNTNKFINYLQESNPELSNVNIQKQYPNTLKIFYKLKEPIAFIKTNNGYLYLSDGAKILSKVKKIDSKKKLTEILYYQIFDYSINSIGDTLDFTDIRYSLEFLKKIKNFELVVESIDINSPSMIRLNLNKSVVIFTTEKDIDGQINNLDKIIRQFKVEGKSFSLLDLRFDKPILKLN
ncbi:MAG: FtsQ-type POTRA domain-containing protein [bacterium]